MDFLCLGAALYALFNMLPSLVASITRGLGGASSTYHDVRAAEAEVLRQQQIYERQARALQVKRRSYRWAKNWMRKR